MQGWGLGRTCSCCFRCSFSLRTARSTAASLGEVTVLGLVSSWPGLLHLSRSSNRVFSSCRDLPGECPHWYQALAGCLAALVLDFNCPGKLMQSGRAQAWPRVQAAKTHLTCWVSASFCCLSKSSAAAEALLAASLLSWSSNKRLCTRSCSACTCRSHNLQCVLNSIALNAAFASGQTHVKVIIGKSWGRSSHA